MCRLLKRHDNVTQRWLGKGMEDKDNLLVYSLGHSDPYCAVTVSLNLSVSLNQTATHKMDIWDVRVIASAQWFGFEWLWISVYNRGGRKFKRSLWKNWKPVLCF